MPKAPSTYAGRLTLVMNTVLELSAEGNLIEVARVAECLNVTERMARDYLSDLEELGLLEYQGMGVYTVNRDRLKNVLMRFAVEGGIYLRPEDLVPETTYFIEKASKILKKITITTSKSIEIRERMLKTAPKEPFHGDSLVIPVDEYADSITGFSEGVLGEASIGEVRNYIIAETFPITVTYIASATALLTKQDFEEATLKFRLRPKIRSFTKRDPFDVGEPLYELSVEYPELLLLGRKMAARLLKEIERYKNLRDSLDDEPSIAITRGSLIAHGFILSMKCSVLRILMERAESIFTDTVEEYLKRGILLISIVESSRDNRLFRYVKGELELELPEMSDVNFLIHVLRDGDATAPMKLTRERGRSVENWYEFYLRRGERVYKIEFISKKDPLEVQKTILCTLYPEFQIGGRIPVVSDAKERAKIYLWKVKKKFESVLKMTALAHLNGGIEDIVGEVVK